MSMNYLKTAQTSIGIRSKSNNMKQFFNSELSGALIPNQALQLGHTKIAKSLLLNSILCITVYNGCQCELRITLLIFLQKNYNHMISMYILF